MKKVTLGSTGMEVTKIGLGGIPIQRLTEAEAIKVVRHALGRGINWIDTANGYGPSEEIIGKTIKDFKRGTFHIFSKALGKSPDQLKEQVELSLTRLGVECIDLYQFHMVPGIESWDSMRKEGTVDILLEMKASGKIKHVGASAHRKDVALTLAEDPDIEIVQFPFNFIVDEDSREVMERCVSLEKGFIAMKPLGGGMICDARLCITFLNLFDNAAANPGFESKEEIDEVVDIAVKGTGPDDHDRSAMERIIKEMGTRFCRRCGYCTPCPEGVSIPSLMTTESFVKRFSRQELTEGWISKALKTGGLCTRCGQCEPKCPYELPIMEMIQEGMAILKDLEKKAT
jgi:predicted aldo/keto reductase-like oxidoreductase